MDTSEFVSQFRRPAWQTGIGTVLGYGVILAFMFVVLFVIPWLVFEYTAIGL
ncbi:MAG: hypothetical protein ABEI96_11150 [Haloarculaceae archaeon]